MCKYWKEYDRANGTEFEYCKVKNKTVSCCGEECRCHFKLYKEE